MDIQQMFNNDDSDLKFGYLIHGHYQGYVNEELTTIDAVLAYDQEIEHIYFEKSLSSLNIMAFETPEEAERYFDENQENIMSAGSDVFPDAEHTIYNIIDFRPKSEEVRPLTDIICRCSIDNATVYCLCVKLFDNSPKVNNMYFVGNTNGELAFVKQFKDATLFENKDSANTFYLENETEIKALAQTYKDREVFENAGIVIAESIVRFGKETVVGTIPDRPIPPKPPVPPKPPIPPFPPRPPFPPHHH